MGISARQILQRFLQDLKETGRNTFDKDEFELAIALYMGADPRTIKKYWNLMEKLGIIQRVKGDRVKINYRTGKFRV